MRANKVHRNFKLCPKLNEKLVREAYKTHLTQTAIIQVALSNYFKLKRA